MPGTSHANLPRARRADEYFATHGSALEDAFSTSVTECMTVRPDDPLKFIGSRMLKQSSLQVSAACRTTESPAITSEWATAGWLSSAGIEQQLASALLSLSSVTRPCLAAAHSTLACGVSPFPLLLGVQTRPNGDRSPSAASTRADSAGITRTTG